MQNLFGNVRSGQTPDIVTYYHTDDKSGTVGLWDGQGKLYNVAKFKNSSIDFRLDYSDAKHIMLVGNATGQLIDKEDFDENQKEHYFAYLHSNEGTILMSDLSRSQQVVLFKQKQTPNIESGKKCPKHILQAIGLSLSTSQETVTLIKCAGYYHVAHVLDGKIRHTISFNAGLAPEVIHYKVLAFYQEHSIHPNTILSTSSVDEDVNVALLQHLPSIKSLLVPETHIAASADGDQSVIYPHYLAFVCVL